MSLPSAMGRMWLSPLIAEFAKLHPHLSLELEYTDDFVDIVSKGYDLAIRIGDLPDSRLIARKLCDQRRIMCASPEYIEQHGAPTHPDDLVKHQCLSYTGFSTFPDWRLVSGGKAVTIRPKGSIKSNDNEGLLIAASHGLGIVAGSTWLMAKGIKKGQLVRVLTEWTFSTDSGVYFVRPSSAYTSAKVDAFKTFIESHFSAKAPWEVSDE
jgi:DNA-binding transcriptional LysR family regulator